ncbi:MAG: hypothetical protein IBX57_00995 [Gammaproteobacteria bacterium]|nr:hypothetical protein [Gammaproteobacteria bacterium]
MTDFNKIAFSLLKKGLRGQPKSARPVDLSEFSYQGNNTGTLPGLDGETVRDFQFNPNADVLYILTGTGMYQYSFTILNDLGSVFLQSSYIFGSHNYHAFNWKADGLSIFLLSDTSTSANIVEYEVNDKFNINSLGAIIKSRSIKNFINTARALTFSSDGKYVFVNSSSTGQVVVFTMPTPFDIANATYTTGIYAGPSLRRAYISHTLYSPNEKFLQLNTANSTISQYTFSENPISFSADNVALDFSSLESNIVSFYLKPTGDKFFILGNEFKTVFEYVLT